MKLLNIVYTLISVQVQVKCQEGSYFSLDRAYLISAILEIDLISPRKVACHHQVLLMIEKQRRYIIKLSPFCRIYRSSSTGTSRKLG